MMNFQVVDVPTVLPQECICQRGPKPPFIDTGIDVFERRIYLCALCVKEILTLADPERVPVAERDRALDDAKTVRARLAAQEEQLRALEVIRSDRDRAVALLEEERQAHASLKGFVGSRDPSESPEKKLQTLVAQPARGKRRATAKPR
jgi:hypothetical protein